jgi:hypothetical protein
VAASESAPHCSNCNTAPPGATQEILRVSIPSPQDAEHFDQLPMMRVASSTRGSVPLARAEVGESETPVKETRGGGGGGGEGGGGGGDGGGGKKPKPTTSFAEALMTMSMASDGSNSERASWMI